MNETAASARQALDFYRYNEASQLVYEFFWNDFCDWYVEGTKLSFKYGDEKEKDRAASVLLAVLEESLRLLHPFLAFVTEEIYSKLPEFCAEGACKRADILMTAAYPEENAARIDEPAAARFGTMQELVRNIRALRTECGIDPQLKLTVSLYVEKNSPSEAAPENAEIIKMLSGLSELDFITAPDQKPAASIGTVGLGFDAFLFTG